MTAFRQLITSILLALTCIFFIREGAYAQDKTIQSFELQDVRIKSGPFYEAQQTDLKYILSLDVDRLLVPFLRDAGLPVNTTSYGNWENTGLDGHIGGHYLSALSLMYASTGNEEIKKRLDYMVDQLEKCQLKNGNGYVGGIPDGQLMWNEIRNGKVEADNFSLNNRWVPLYNIHKLYAGLRDAYLIGQNKKAKDVFVKLCDWFINLTNGLTDEQIQVMLKSEHGGMNEVFADATEITGDKKYLQMAKRMSHRFILDPLVGKKDALTGLHANTQIPKVIGYKKIADVAHEAAWSDAAAFFWNTVVENRSVSVGGNSVREHFHPANDFSSMIESNQGPETCNTYNMLRLTKALYLTDPKVSYLDYYERAVYNHILSSQHPDGGFVYFTPMRPRHYRVYSSAQESFWCCVGSGIENHGKYGELIYAHSGAELFVNLFIASQLEWKEKGINVNQKTTFPFSETSTLELSLDKPTQFTLNIRNPSWVKEGKFRVTINGKDIPVKSSTSGYVSINRKWKNGDVITITLPMQTRVEFLPDGSSWGSFIHGPIVMAAVTDSTDLSGLRADGSRMGHVANGKFYPVDEAPVVVKRSNDFLSTLQPVSGKPLTFSMASIVYPEKYKSVQLVPFFTIHDSRYSIYWQIAEPDKLESLKKELVLKEKERQTLENKTVDLIVMGEQQPEVDHGFKGEKTEAGTSDGKAWRNAGGWFSYEFNNKNKEGAVIRITYDNEWFNRKFDLILNDKLFKTIELSHKDSAESFFEDYEIPTEILNGLEGEIIRVKISAHAGFQTGRMFSLRLMTR